MWDHNINKNKAFPPCIWPGMIYLTIGSLQLYQADVLKFAKDLKDSRGLAELSCVTGSVLVPSVSEPGLDLSVGESTLLLQGHHFTLHTQTQLRIAELDFYHI